jgi:hypothetical protein
MLESTWDAFPTELTLEQSYYRAHLVLLWCPSCLEEIKMVHAISYHKTTHSA